MDIKIRVVAAVVHEDTNEVEIIIEKTIETEIEMRDSLISIWINCEKEFDNLLEGEKMPRPDNTFIEEAYRNIQGGYIDMIVSHNINAKYIIAYAARHDHPIKIVNKGGGVKRIVTADNVCPHCKGKGTV